MFIIDFEQDINIPTLLKKNELPGFYRVLVTSNLLFYSFFPVQANEGSQNIK